jgi:hypothetical protein
MKKNDPTQAEPKNMRTTKFFIPAESFQLPNRTREQGRCAGWQRLTAKLPSRIEPEHRLWKLSTEAASPKFGRLELIAFLFLVVLVSAATIFSFDELLHVVKRGALEQTVQALMTR